MNESDSRLLKLFSKLAYKLKLENLSQLLPIESLKLNVFWEQKLKFFQFISEFRFRSQKFIWEVLEKIQNQYL